MRRRTWKQEDGSNKEAACAESMLNNAREASNSPTHILASSRPKRTLCTPTRDDDPRYAVSSYRRFTEKVEVAEVDPLGNPRHIQTMA